MSLVFFVFISLPLMYIGTSTLLLNILAYSNLTASRSGEPGAYVFTGSFTATGTLKNPFPMGILLFKI